MAMAAFKLYKDYMQPRDFPGIEGNLQSIPERIHEALQAGRILAKLSIAVILDTPASYPILTFLAAKKRQKHHLGALDLRNVAAFFSWYAFLSWISKITHPEKSLFLPFIIMGANKKWRKHVSWSTFPFVLPQKGFE